VKPVPGSGYLQEFTAVTGSREGANNRLETNLSGRTQTLRVNSGFIPFSFSSSGTATSVPVVFAGYGITATEYNYDDYAGVDVKDKFVLILRHEPQENDPKSVFDGRQITRHSTFVNKAVNAKMHGARGVILIRADWGRFWAWTVSRITMTPDARTAPNRTRPIARNARMEAPVEMIRAVS